MKVPKHSFHCFLMWMRRNCLIMIFILAACQQDMLMQSSAEVSITPAAILPSEKLPPPRLQGTVSLEETLVKRRSVRNFSDQPLTMEEVGQLLWAAQGVTSPQGFRTAPSAGALYPLEIYVVTDDGVFRYLPSDHQITLQKEGNVRTELYEAALSQSAVQDAPAVFVITAVYERTVKKYGEARSPRYVHLEAGHAAQNLLLQATALELGAVPIGAFDDDRVNEIMGLPGEEQPLYLIPVGHPQAQE